jgi:ABC-type multidrug transport system ATPase subunit
MQEVTTNNGQIDVSSVVLTDACKYYNGRTVFENLSLKLNAGDALAITGPNGSGKSTLIKTIIGYVPLSSGKIEWSTSQSDFNPEHIYKACSLAAPYLDLFEDFTLLENVRIFGDLKGFRDGMKPEDVISFMELEHARDKKFKAFSSGMRQRTKLGLSFCSKASILLFDEPLSNLDTKGYDWYQRHTSGNMNHQIVVVGSNIEGPETHFCNKRIQLG